MQARVLFVCLAILWAAAGPAAGQADDATTETPQQAFRRVFAQPMEPPERVRLLERIAKEHPDSQWADDALWILGEAARQQRLSRRVVYYWQFLVSRYPNSKLEEFTCTVEIYRKSNLARIKLLLEAEGIAYIPGSGEKIESAAPEVLPSSSAETERAQRIWIGCLPFNPVPMVVWAELGRCYEQLKRPRLALKAYRKALESAPETGQWQSNYRESIQRLEKRLKVQSPPAAASGPAPQQSAGLRRVPLGSDARGRRQSSQAGPPEEQRRVPEPAEAAESRKEPEDSQ